MNGGKAEGVGTLRKRGQVLDLSQLGANLEAGLASTVKTLAMSMEF